MKRGMRTICLGDGRDGRHPRLLHLVVVSDLRVLPRDATSHKLRDLLDDAVDDLSI
jgi:hypothetical protein